MKNKIVDVPSINRPIQASPGFAKKHLSDFKLDILGLCGFGCRYCSSNEGNYLRIKRREFAEHTAHQLGSRMLPTDTPSLMFAWPDVLVRLEEQLAKRRPDWGAGQTLVFSMLTDGFSPELVRRGTTESALRLVLERTSFRIRVLTKNATVGSKEWIKFFNAHPGRFVVGLSTGTLDDDWARRIEIGTSSPTARLRALRNLQESDVPTYGMLCPVFPDLLERDALDSLISHIRPESVEHIWAEPYNDRNNWATVRAGYKPGTFGYRWLTNVYEQGNTKLWSGYATKLYSQLRRRAERDGWLQKLRYLLYERQIREADAPKYRGLDGVLLQSTPDEDGFSQNPFLANEQRRRLTTRPRRDVASR
jgi:DNA repair photolyase